MKMYLPVDVVRNLWRDYPDALALFLGCDEVDCVVEWDGEVLVLKPVSARDCSGPGVKSWTLPSFCACTVRVMLIGVDEVE